MIGRTISHYKILEKLGEGGMGEVYLAEDTKLKRTVALKFLPPELTRDTDARERFIQEAQAASALDHPNICSIYEIDETDNGQMFITMGYYEGETVKDKIDRGPLEIDEAIDITVQVAKGLEKTHKTGIIHRDIKPANILITEDGVVKIVDFGLAKLAGRTVLTKEGITLGTVAYMSPEQTQGTDVDHRADIWALGVILYEMLAGERPFKGDYDQAIMYSILNEKPEPIKNNGCDLPPGLTSIINKTLSKDPDKRYQTMGELLADLKNLGSKDFDTDSFRGVQSSKNSTPKWLVFTFGTLVLLIASILYFLNPFGAKSNHLKSLVVLPVENLTGDTELEYFISGMHASLIGEISKISALRVISKTTSNTYKKAERSISDIASELDVEAAIEASVLSLGDSVLIQVKLVGDFPDEKQLWLRDYMEGKSQILNLYNLVTKEISQEINVVLTPQEESLLADTRSISPEAYDAYMKGQFFGERLGRKDLYKAIEYFETAVEKEPDWAQPYTGLSLAWGGLMQMGFIEPTTAIPKLYEYLNKAVKLDPNLVADAQYNMATLAVWVEWNWEKGEREFERIIEIKPNNALNRVFYGHYLYIMNRPEEGRKQADIALELDPKRPLILALVCMARIWEGEFKEAVALAEKAVSLEPTYFTQGALNSAYYHLEDFDKWFETWKKIAWWDEDALAVIDTIYYEQGLHAATEAIIKVNIENDQEFGGGQAQRYCAIGNFEKALDCLEQAYIMHDPNMPYLAFFAVDFPELRNHPRFIALMEKMKLPFHE